MQVRSKNDAELLYEAKYGKRGEDGKMTREQYAALRRRVGGTAKGEHVAGTKIMRGSAAAGLGNIRGPPRVGEVFACACGLCADPLQQKGGAQLHAMLGWHAWRMHAPPSPVGPELPCAAP